MHVFLPILLCTLGVSRGQDSAYNNTDNAISNNGLQDTDSVHQNTEVEAANKTAFRMPPSFLQYCGSLFVLPILIDANLPVYFPKRESLLEVIVLALDDAADRIPDSYFPLQRGALRENFRPEFVTIDVAEISQPNEVAHNILNRMKCRVPVISLILSMNETFQKLLSILEFFHVAVITPFPAPSLDFHRSFSNFISFSAPQTTQVTPLLDFCNLVGWTRLALIYSLDIETMQTVEEFKLLAGQQGIHIQPLTPLPRHLMVLNELSTAELVINTLSREIAKSYMQDDFTVFIIIVKTPCLGAVASAIQQSGLSLLPGVAFIATNSVSYLFNSTVSLLFGEQSDITSKQLLKEAHIDLNEVNGTLDEGLVFLSAGYSSEWEIGNKKLRKMFKDVSLETGIEASKNLFGLYEILLYDIVFAVWEVTFREYPLLVINDCLENPKWYHTVYERLHLICVDNPNFDEYVSSSDFTRHFRNQDTSFISNILKQESYTFIGLTNTVKLTPYGSGPITYTMFNVRRLSHYTTMQEAVPIPIGRWKSTERRPNIATGLSSPYQLTLRVERGTLVSFLARLVPFSCYNDFISSTNTKKAQSLNSQLAADLRTVVFPGKYPRIPRDCVFCQQLNGQTARVNCLVCEVDRNPIMTIYKEFKSWNPTILVGSRSLNPNTDPNNTPFCELWPSAVKCISPWSYIIDLEGLELEGPLPQSLGRLRRVEQLRFFRNAFSGTFPILKPNLCPGRRHDNASNEQWARTLSQRSSLKSLLLGKNRLTGNLPDDLMDCQQLRILSIRNNLFSGSLPNSLCHLRELTDFDFSNNVFTGQLPSCIGGRQGDNRAGNTSGMVNLQYLKGDENRLSGTIPWSFRKLNHLISVSLKSNAFTGVMPDVWDTLGPDVVVDLSQNPGLEPPLPPSLARRIQTDFSKVTVDPHMFGCPEGHRAPRPEDWTFDEHAAIVPPQATQGWNLSIYCQPCPKGAVPTKDSRHCYICPGGSVAPTEGSSRCIECPAGYFSKEGGIRCRPCPPGTYNYLSGSTICHPCPFNHFTEELGSVSCLPCPIGANCTTPEQQRNPEAFPGWYKTFRFLDVKDGTFKRDDIWQRRRLQETRATPFPNEYTEPQLIYSDTEIRRSLATILTNKGNTPIQRFDVFPCPLPANCLSGNACAANSYGAFCHRCSPGYTTNLVGISCKHCRPLAITMIRLFFTAGLITGIIVFIVKSFRKTAKVHHAPRSSLTRRWKPQAVVLKVFTNWVELTAQALVMAIQSALNSDDKFNVTRIPDRVEGVYNFIQNLDDPFFLLLPLDCVSPSWAPTPLHSGLLFAIACPIVIFLGLLFRNVWRSASRFNEAENQHQHQKKSTKAICKTHENVIMNNDSKKVVSEITDHITKTEEDTSKIARKRVFRNYCSSNRYSPTTAHKGNNLGTLAPLDSNRPYVIPFIAAPVVKFYTSLKSIFSSAWPTTVGAFIPVFFLIHPALTRQFLNNLDCVELDEARVVRDYQLTCNRGTHPAFMTLAWIGMLLWTFGMPVLFGIMLRSKRHMLNDPQVLLEWGFLLDGYESQYYWWEVWAMIRKVLVDLPAVIPFLNEDLQYVSLLALSVISLAAHVGAEPFDNRCFKIADRLESMVLWSFLMTLLTIPIHKTLNKAGSSYFALILSKIVMASTLAVSGIFVVLAGLFYVRPILPLLDATGTSEVSGKKGDINKSKRSKSHSLDHNIPEQPLCEVLSSSSRKHSGDHELSFFKNGNTSHISNISHSVCYVPSSSSSHCVTQPSLTGLRSSLSQESSTYHDLHHHNNKYFPSFSNTVISEEEEEKEAIVQHNTMFYKAIRYCRIKAIDPLSVLIRQCLKNLCLNSCVRRTLHMTNRRIWMNNFGDIDVSELSSRDKKFLREVVFNEILETQFKTTVQSINAGCLKDGLMRIFRFRAFQDDVQKTRLFLEQLEAEPRYLWKVLPSRATFQPFMTAIKDFRNSSIDRIYSISTALKRHSNFNANSDSPFSDKVLKRTYSMLSMFSGTKSDHGNEPPRAISLMSNSRRQSEDGPITSTAAGGGTVTPPIQTPENQIIQQNLNTTTKSKFQPDIVFETITTPRYHSRVIAIELWHRLRFQIIWMVRLRQALKQFPQIMNRHLNVRYGLTIEELQESISILRWCTLTESTTKI